MALRRDRLLQQMGITQWTLRHPAILQGEVAISLPEEIRLLLIARQPISLAEPLLRDILQALQLSAQQVYVLAPEQLEMLPAAPDRLICFLGTALSLPFSVPTLTTLSLAELTHNPRAKRALWQQICQHEADIFPDAGRFGRRVTD